MEKVIWIGFSLLTAFFISIGDVLNKKVTKKVNIYVLACVWPIFTLPYLLILLVREGIPTVMPPFYVALCVSTVLISCSLILYFKALKADDLSLVVPMRAFTPIFLLITSPLIIGEVSGPMAIVGIIFIVGGSYFLNVKDFHLGVLAPFKALNKEGPRCMLLIAVLYSVAANFDKIGLNNSSPIFWLFSLHVSVGCVLCVIMFIHAKDIGAQIKSSVILLAIIGAISSLALIFQMYALRLTLVSYVISIKRMSVVFSVIFGYFIFKEKDFRSRFLGVVLMAIGVLIISIFS